MDLMQKLELIKAANKLADFWEVKLNYLIQFPATLNPNKLKEWNNIIDETNEFIDSNIEERAIKLGFTINVKETE